MKVIHHRDDVHVCTSKACYTPSQQLLITPVVAGLAIGYQAQTTRNKLSQGKFPLPTVELDGRTMVRCVAAGRELTQMPKLD